MRKIILFAAISLLLSACGNKTPEWEYEVIQIKGSELPNTCGLGTEAQYLEQSKFSPLNFPNASDIKTIIDNPGKEGWELVNVYTTVETVFPNFGNNEYVTGLRTNTRTSTINFVFKRLKTGEEKNTSDVVVETPYDENFVDTAAVND